MIIQSEKDGESTMTMNMKPGYIVRIYDKFYKVKNVEPFQYDTGKESTAFFSAVASGSAAGFKNITELEPDDSPCNHLFWVTFGVEDGMEYKFKIPTGSARFGTDTTKDIGFVDNVMSPWFAPNEEFGFWLIKDYYPSIDANNIMSVPLVPKVRFIGVKYEIEAVTSPVGNVPVKEITIGGVRN